MNKRLITLSKQGGANYYGLIICAALFICGCIAGVMSAAHVDSTLLSGHLSGYLDSGGQAARSGFFDCLFTAGKYHLFAVFFGFSLLGVVCVPALAAVRGFFLCFSVSAVVRLYGGGGALLALAMFGTGAAITLPCFFVLAVQSFAASLSVMRMVVSKGARPVISPYGDGFFKRCLICAAVLSCSAAFDLLAAPRLIAYAASRVL